MNIDFAFLRNVRLFSDLEEHEFGSLADLFKARQFKRGDIVFFEEDTGKYMYVVREGRVKVSRLLPNGKEMILAFHETGEYFGEMSLIDGGTSPATVTAMSPTMVYVITAEDFPKLTAHPKINMALLKMLSSRCRDAWAQIEVLTFHNADARIRTALFQLSQKKGVRTERGTMISMHLTHKELADITGISRETATRVLSHLQSEDLLKVDARHFIIEDPEALVNDLLFE